MRSLPGPGTKNIQQGTEITPSWRCLKYFEQQCSSLKKVFIQNNAVERHPRNLVEAEPDWNQAEIRHGGVTNQGTTERTFWETGSQAEHKMTGHHGKRGELVNGKCEWEELKPQMKQPGYMNSPSPKRGPVPGRAIRLTKGPVWKGEPVERDWASHGSSQRQKSEGKHS